MPNEDKLSQGKKVKTRKTRANSMMEGDIEELRKSLDFMSAELKQVTKQLRALPELVSEVRQLKKVIEDKDKTIVELERRVHDLEQYTRMEDVIISGLNIKPRSYARAAAVGADVSEDAPKEDQETLEMQVIQFFKSKNIALDANGISACHTLPRKDPKFKPAIIVRFANRKHKVELLMQGKKLKGSEVYLNEHLTKKNAEIAREARNLRKSDKINATWTRNCKVMIRPNSSTREQAKAVMVRELKDLDPYR